MFAVILKIFIFPSPRQDNSEDYVYLKKTHTFIPAGHSVNLSILSLVVVGLIKP